MLSQRKTCIRRFAYNSSKGNSGFVKPKNPNDDFTRSSSYNQIVKSIYSEQGVPIEMKNKNFKGYVNDLTNVDLADMGNYFKFREQLLVNLCLANKNESQALEDIIIEKNSTIKFSHMIEYCWLFCINGMSPKLFDLMKSRIRQELDKSFSLKFSMFYKLAIYQQFIEMSYMEEKMNRGEILPSKSSNSQDGKLIDLWPKNLERVVVFPFPYENYFRMSYELNQQITNLGFTAKIFDEILIDQYKIPLVLEKQDKTIVQDLIVNKENSMQKLQYSIIHRNIIKRHYKGDYVCIPVQANAKRGINPDPVINYLNSNNKLFK